MATITNWKWLAAACAIVLLVAQRCEAQHQPAPRPPYHWPVSPSNPYPGRPLSPSNPYRYPGDPVDPTYRGPYFGPPTGLPFYHPRRPPSPYPYRGPSFGPPAPYYTPYWL